LAYCEFTLETTEGQLGVTTQETDLFPNLLPVSVPDWLPGLLARGTRLALITEKSRSEFIIVPILLAARELSGDRFSIFSGQRLDVDLERAWSGNVTSYWRSVLPCLPYTPR
jgi:hypothetical protein